MVAPFIEIYTQRKGDIDIDVEMMESQKEEIELEVTQK